MYLCHTYTRVQRRLLLLLLLYVYETSCLKRLLSAARGVREALSIYFSPTNYARVLGTTQRIFRTRTPEVCATEVARPRTTSGDGGCGSGPMRREEIGKRAPDRGITRGTAMVKRSNRSQQPQPVDDYLSGSLTLVDCSRACIFIVL